MAIYLKIDTTKPQAALFRTEAAAKFLLTHPKNNLSVNIKKDGSVAWVKMEREDDLATLFTGIIIDREINSNTKALTDVYAGDWYPEE